jgi:hypothetical protein
LRDLCSQCLHVDPIGTEIAIRTRLSFHQVSQPDAVRHDPTKLTRFEKPKRQSDFLRRAPDSFEIRKEIVMAAPIEISFQAVLDELGPECQMPDGRPFPMKNVARPGERWFRDPGDQSGHLWGHAQAIKQPTLLEICGPMPMSCPAINDYIQY